MTRPCRVTSPSCLRAIFRKGEAIGIPIALVILVFVFGALVAALIPVLLAVFAIVVGIAMIALIGTVSPLSFFAVNMLTFMGLAVGIDYSLFVVSRFREERARGLDVEAAIERSAGTAGRAVMFSGLTVVLALVGMLIVPTQIFISLAVGAIVVVLVTMVAALTLLPAVLRLLGDRVNRGRIPFLSRHAKEDTRHGFWARAVHVAMRRPAISASCRLRLAPDRRDPSALDQHRCCRHVLASRQPERETGLRRPEP